MTKEALYLSSFTSEAQFHSTEHVDLSVYSHPSTNTAKDNQDSAAIITLQQNEYVLAVSDGAGGQPGGQSASHKVIKQLAKELLHPENQDQLIRASILNALEFSNKAIMDSKSGGGSTACVVSIEENIARPFHVGDSIIAITGQKGKLIYKNTEHSPLGYALKSEIIDDELLDSNISHQVFNLIGNTEMHIEIGPEIELKKSDTLFICSDGITDIIPLDECLEVVRSGAFVESVNKLVDSFLMKSKDHEHKDDATFIVCRLKNI